MRKAWTTEGGDLFLDLTLSSGRRAGLVCALRDAIRSGRLGSGMRLPSSRALAADLGLARGTVVEAYQQLVAAGYLTAERGRGTMVSAGTRDWAASTEPVRSTTPAVSFLPGPPDLASFPRRRWLAALRRALATAPDEALDYGDPRGMPELRQALAAYIGRTRGVMATADRLVVCSGFVQGLALVCRALRAGGATAIAFEDPSWSFHRSVAAAEGLRIVGLPVDDEGPRLDRLALEDVAAVVVTPAHQAPTGVTMSAARRAALLRWSQDHDGIVVENDYDAEFRYDQPPVGAMQGLDPERVVHAGSASKTLAPGVRLAWLTLPHRLIDPVVAAKIMADRGSAVLDQMAFAQLVESGDYDRHVRRMRRSYQSRRDLLIGTLSDRVPALRVLGVAAGVHAVVELPSPGPTEKEVVALGRQRSVLVTGMGSFRHHPHDDDRQAIVIGYAQPPWHRYRESVERVAALLYDACAG